MHIFLKRKLSSRILSSDVFTMGALFKPHTAAFRNTVNVSSARVLFFPVQVNNAIRWINLNPAADAIGFLNYYSLDGNLSGGQRYPKKNTCRNLILVTDEQ